MNLMKAGADASAETKQTNAKKPLSVIVNTILILAILLGIFCSFTAFISKNGGGIPSFFGIRPFAIQSDSMAPFFSNGDLIIDKTVRDPSELKVGDVITFWTVIGGERVLNSHRIIEILDKGTYLYFTTKGDNNTIEDSIGVHQSEIVGKYETHIPNMGAVIDYMQTGIGFLLAIVVPVFLFFVYHLVQFFKALFAYQAEKVRLQIKMEQIKAGNADSADADTGKQATDIMSADGTQIKQK